VMPTFSGRADRVDAAKQKRLAAACKRAVERREPPRSAPADYVIEPGGEPTPAYEMRAAQGNGRSNGGGASLATRVNKAAENAFAAFIRGRNDEQLDKLMGSNAGLRVAFGGMERAFVPENSGGFRGAIQWELESSRGLRTWHVAIDDGRARARPGAVDDPKVTMKMSVPMFARVLAREVDPAKAMLEGRLTVTGDFAVASRIGPMFGEDARW
jgi:SCP-2 sterol transfer family